MIWHCNHPHKRHTGAPSPPKTASASFRSRVVPAGSCLTCRCTSPPSRFLLQGAGLLHQSCSVANNCLVVNWILFFLLARTSRSAFNKNMQIQRCRLSGPTKAQHTKKNQRKPEEKPCNSLVLCIHVWANQINALCCHCLALTTGAPTRLQAIEEGGLPHIGPSNNRHRYRLQVLRDLPFEAICWQAHGKASGLLLPAQLRQGSLVSLVSP